MLLFEAEAKYNSKKFHLYQHYFFPFDTKTIPFDIQKTTIHPIDLFFLALYA